jgi:hypothetical protein
VSGARYGYRFGRFGTAVVILTMPLTLPAFALAAALVEAWNVVADTLCTVPGAARFVVKGRP